MVRRGQLRVERDERQRVWVLIDDDAADDPEHSSGGHGSASDEELTTLRAQVKSLRELADYRGELLKEAEWRYHELLGQLKQAQDTTATLARALPAPEPGRRPSPPLVALRQRVSRSFDAYPLRLPGQAGIQVRLVRRGVRVGRPVVSIVGAVRSLWLAQRRAEPVGLRWTLKTGQVGKRESCS